MRLCWSPIKWTVESAVVEAVGIKTIGVRKTMLKVRFKELCIYKILREHSGILYVFLIWDKI